jgi:hypothetical protein
MNFSRDIPGFREISSISFIIGTQPEKVATASRVCPAWPSRHGGP